MTVFTSTLIALGIARGPGVDPSLQPAQPFLGCRPVMAAQWAPRRARLRRGVDVVPVARRVDAAIGLVPGVNPDGQVAGEVPVVVLDGWVLAPVPTAWQGAATLGGRPVAPAFGDTLR